MDHSMDTVHQVWIASAKDSIKTIKTALEQSNIYDRTSGIQKIETNAEEYFVVLDGQTLLAEYHSLVPTTITTGLESSTGGVNIQELLPLFSVDLQKYALFASRQSSQGSVEGVSPSNPVSRVVKSWLERLSRYSQAEIQHIIQAESWSYQIYHPLLLLGPSSFRSEAWHTLSKDEAVINELPRLYDAICSATNCTHVAINGRIPSDTESSPSKDSAANILRSPACLVPLHGKFGSRTDIASEPTFREALWASATQNGIHQIFAPMHTMFSRGNVKEKARILHLAQMETEPYSAIDLYAGIGYFAFSYAKGGAAVVLGWEINDWSVEGFRRGAGKNGWEVKVHRTSEPDAQSLRSWIDSRHGNRSHSPKLIMFAESNEAAPERVESLRNALTPIRHVNCGYLPSSSESWSLAVQCLDPVQGGCIHVHENVQVEHITLRGLEVQQVFEALVKRLRCDTSMAVQCKHVEKVKSYAPGIMHCVFDIYVDVKIDEL